MEKERYVRQSAFDRLLENNRRLQMLKEDTWINFDVLSLLGLDCVGATLDYRARVALMSLLPVLVVVTSGILYVTNKSKKTNETQVLN